jgi:hypothetical protein
MGFQPLIRPASESKMKMAGFVLPVRVKSEVSLWTWPVGAPPGIGTEPTLVTGPFPMPPV